MPDAPAFRELQYAFAAHIRDPDHNPPPDGIEDRRMAIYRDLFFNNVSQMLAGTFPVLHRILGETRWRMLMREYFSTHESHTPLFLEMPQELLRYLTDERGERADDPPFMAELAHYEWVELALSVDENELTDADVDRDGDLLDGVPALSPLAWPLTYRFPVHRISPDFQPDAPDPEATFLVVYRDPDDKVGFLSINPVTARLLELMKADDGQTGRELLEAIAAEMQHPNPQTVVDGGRALLAELHDKYIVLGTRRGDTGASGDTRA